MGTTSTKKADEEYNKILEFNVYVIHPDDWDDRNGDFSEYFIHFEYISDIDVNHPIHKPYLYQIKNEMDNYIVRYGKISKLN